MNDNKILSISIPEYMDEQLDDLVKSGFFSSKSECIRESLRTLFNRYQPDQLSENKTLVGATMALWDYHDGAIGSSLSKVREKFDDTLLGNLHLHVSDAYCLDVLISTGSNIDILQLIKDVREIKKLTSVESIVLPSITKHKDHK